MLYLYLYNCCVLQTDNKLDAIVVPVGGGGMLAGSIIAAKVHSIHCLGETLSLYGVYKQL